MHICYVDIETAFSNEDLFLKYRRGERVRLSPDTCKVISIQFKPFKGSLTILKEWEEGERGILEKAMEIISRPWNILPIGYNVSFDLAFINERAHLYGIGMDRWHLHHGIPHIDIKHICVGMNGFRLKGSGMDMFCHKPPFGHMVPIWYHDGAYDKIIDYVSEEAEAFEHLYFRLKETLPVFRERNGFYNRMRKKGEDHGQG